MDFETIYAWTAKRAGGRITIYGKTREGNARRVCHVDFVETNNGKVRAQDKDGTNYWLATTP